MKSVHIAILRDLCGDLFCETPERRWFDSTRLRSLIRFTPSAFDRLPILADALEEAGCTDAEILAHRRQPGEHCAVLGVDLILGKE